MYEISNPLQIEKPTVKKMSDIPIGVLRWWMHNPNAQST